MSLDIRNAIYENVAGNSEEQFQAIIIDAIDSREEKMLPGLGVLFELIWKQSTKPTKTKLLKILVDSVKNNAH